MKTGSILSTLFLPLESLYEFFICILLIRYNTYDIVLQPKALILKNTNRCTVGMTSRNSQTHAVTHLRATFSFLKIHVLPLVRLNVKT